MRPHPPARIPKPVPEGTPSGLEVYRDCVVKASTSEQLTACYNIITYDVQVRELKNKHQLDMAPQRRKDKKQRMEVFDKRVERCLSYEAQGMNPDGTNSCYKTAQVTVGNY